MTMTDISPDAEPHADSPSAPQAPPPAPFPDARGRSKGYAKAPVDAFLAQARAAFEGSAPEGSPLIDAAVVREVAFPLVRHGYAIPAVDTALGRIEDAFAARERETLMAQLGPDEWVARARANAQEILDRISRPRRRRFARTSVMRFGYRVDEVDIVADRLRRYLTAGEPLAVEQVRNVAFRMQRRGYRETQVDALLDAVIDVILAVR